MYTHCLVRNTDEAPLSMQSGNEIEKAAEVESKSVLICSSSMYNLPVPVVTPNRTMIFTSEFTIVNVFTLEK